MEINKIRIADVDYDFRDATTLKDAPEDGKLYARKGGKWVPTAQELTPEQLSNIDNIPTKADKTELTALEQRMNASILSETTRATEAEAALQAGATTLQSKVTTVQSAVTALQAEVAALKAIINEITTKE